MRRKITKSQKHSETLNNILNDLSLDIEDFANVHAENTSSLQTNRLILFTELFQDRKEQMYDRAGHDPLF